MHHLHDDNMRRLLSMMGTRTRSQGAMTTDTDQSEAEPAFQVTSNHETQSYKAIAKVIDLMSYCV